MDYFLEDFRFTSILNLTKKIMIAIEMCDGNLFSQLKSIISRQSNTESIPKRLQKLIQEKEFFSERSAIRKEVILNGKIFLNLLRYLCSKLFMDS